MYGSGVVVFRPATDWIASEATPPKGMFCVESDTKKIKIGDGSTTYSDLTYSVDAVLTSAMATLLSSFNGANQLLQLNSSGKIPDTNLPASFSSFNGPNEILKLNSTGTIPDTTLPTYLTTFNGALQLLQLDSSGLIPANKLPTSALVAITFVSNYAALTATDVSSREGIYYVVDATGDPSGDIHTGSATYAWETIVTPNSWVRLSKQELVSIDPGNIAMKGDSVGEFSDDATYVRMLATERTALGTAILNTQTLVINAPGASYWT